MVRTFVLFLVSIFLLCGCKEATSGVIPGEPPATGISMPRKEIRGVWIATVDRMDWPRNVSDIAAQK